MNYNELKEKAHANAVNHGFWQERFSNEHYLMLVVTEIAEAVESDRKDMRAFLVQFEAGLKYTPKNVTHNERFVSVFNNVIKSSIEDEMADIAIRLADLAGALGIDFDKMNLCKYHRAFDKFTFTENAFALTKGLSRSNISIERRILFGLDYVFNWAESLNIDLWFFIEQKMKYNALRPALHGKKY